MGFLRGGEFAGGELKGFMRIFLFFLVNLRKFVVRIREFVDNVSVSLREVKIIGRAG